MNNWIGGWTPFTMYHGKSIATNSPPYQVDQVAAYNAFARHWQQIGEIFHHTRRREKVTCDDVTAVVNHFGQMINFLLVDLRTMINGNSEYISLQTPGMAARSEAPSNTPIFDHFLGERVMQSIFQWSKTSGEFFNILQLEQLKVYETLLSNSHPEILVYKPITEPLLLLLESCSGCVPVEVEKRLVVLLNQLWVSLKVNQHLLNYFFVLNDNSQNFLIFSLLLPFIHRDGGVGQQSRDALLLSMSMSSSNTRIADYIFHYSNFCPILAAGLSGLYSMLPRSLVINTEGWCRISSEDIVNNLPLHMFANSLGFCNAIVQIAHPSIQRQLVDYLYHGFLVPVVGPALIQNVHKEVVAAIAYVEFFIQSITEEKLQRAFLALLLSPQECSDLPLLTTVISHLHSSDAQLSLVTLNLFNTLIGLYSEDVMVTLVFQYLAPCNHVMLSQRSKLSQPPFTAADRFIKLLPSICQVESTKIDDLPELSVSVSDLITPFSLYLKMSRWKIAASNHACSSWAWRFDAQNPSPTEAVLLVNAGKLIPVIPYSKSLVNSEAGSHSLPYDSCKGEVESVKQRSWSLPIYEPKKASSMSPLPRKKNNLKFEDNPGVNNLCSTPVEQETMDSLGESSGYDSYNAKGSGDSSPLHNNRFRPQISNGISDSHNENLSDNDDSFLQYLDQSEIPDETDDDEIQFIEDYYKVLGVSPKKLNYTTEEEDSDLQSLLLHSLSSADETNNDDNKELLVTHPKPTIGPFLEALINQIDNIFSNNIHVTMLAMHCISNLASYPCPLITSLLLQPSVVLQPAVRSLYQVLGQIKQKIDATLTSQDLPIIIDLRKKFQESCNISTMNDISASAPSAASNPSSVPFSRGSRARNSLTQRFSSFFKRPPVEKASSTGETLVNLPDGSGYKYINTQASADPVSPFLSAPTEKQQAAVCAVLLQEWLLELAALAEEHTVCCQALIFQSIPSSS